MLWTVVLNWNQRGLTAACLRSLAASVSPQHQVVVVDNGSSDGSVEALQAEFPWAVVIRNGANLGFAEGNNVGIRHALARGADLVWLLNNDTEVAPDCVAELVAAAAAHPDEGLFAPKIYLHDRPATLWYAGGELRLHRAAGCIHRGYYEPDAPRYSVEGPVSFVTGCAFLIRRRVIEAIGEMDATLFLYCEDLDWSVKAQRAGFRAWYVPRARVWHKVSRSLQGVGGRALMTYSFARSRLLVQRRYRARLGALALVPLLLTGEVARGAYAAAARGEFRLVRALFRGALHGFLSTPQTNP